MWLIFQCDFCEQLSHSCQTGVFSQQFSIKIVKYKDGILVFGQNSGGHNVVNFSM